MQQVGLSQPDAWARDNSAGPSLTYRVEIGSFNFAARLSTSHRLWLAVKRLHNLIGGDRDSFEKSFTDRIASQV